ncbi:MAG: hypothetical protein HY657_17255 [Acidobacteria bacterium]|nr:hypothetical protein [Acidobacteriota bacterium]
MPTLIRQFVAFALVVPSALSAQSVPDVTTTDPRPNGGLTLAVFAAPYQGTGSLASVLLGAELHGLPGRPAGAGARRLELRYAVTGGPSRIPDRTVSVSLTDTAAGGPELERGVRVLTRLSMPPGTYGVRVTARDTGSSRSVSAVHDVEVIDLRPFSIAMSGLVLTSSAVEGYTHVESDEDRVLPILLRPPAARRRFAQSERLEVQAEIYEQWANGEAEFDQQINVVTRLRALDGRVLWETSDLGTSEALSGDRFGYIHSTLVPIRDVPPGQYIVQVGAETMYGVPTFVSREVPITIVAAP